ncbi:hypothetical protein [Streptomyces sp. SID8352]|uniref:hypothetical protein n=1 Tax=Streptomyces sp. SID8352 TaxID=2690338 RepID=UPI00136B8F8A|nr:hypothetical protein [Streptomyces sp. SID8352]MYU22867.1 hypothetical protein [Streptomyces sp. SID8352]
MRARRPAERLGRRGALLTLKGVMAVGYGAGQIVQPTGDEQGLALLLTVMPLDSWGWAWITAGAAALACAWLPPRRDWPGFLAVWAIASAWAGAYLVSWWPLGESPRGWVIATIFAAFGTVCLVAIGWDEPPRARSEPPRET